MTRYVNYFYILSVIIWIPLQSGLLHFDGKGRSIFFATILVFVFNILHDRQFLKNIFTQPTGYWAVLILFSLINTSFKGLDSDISLIYFFVLKLFSPFLIMLLATKEYVRDNYAFGGFVVLIFVLFGILDLLFLSGGNEVNENTGRTGSMLGNLAPLNMMFLIFLGGLLYVKKHLKLYQAMALSVLSFSSIFISNTRKALGAAVIMLLFIILSQLRLSPKSIVVFIIFSFGLFWTGNFVINNTEIGGRILETEEQATKYKDMDNEALAFLGDRAIQYVLAWELFVKNTWTGVGLKNFSKESSFDYRLHSEYMVQLCENGIVGSLLFFMFYLGLGKNLFRRWHLFKSEHSTILVMVGALLAIVFIQLTAWTYSFPQYFLVYGIIIGHIKIPPQEIKSLVLHNFILKRNNINSENNISP